ncbi:MAG: nuclear transport factor 2 family protein [Pirellulales bacterium]
MFVDRIRRALGVFGLSLVAALSPWAVRAQNAGAPTAAEAAVRQASKEYLAALAKSDVKTLTGYWTAEGTYVDPVGDTFAARDLMAEMSARPPAPRPEARLTNVTVRFLTPDVAVQEGQTEMALRDGTPARGRFHAVWVRQQGRWKLDRLEDHRAAAPSVASRLAVLEPLVGEWTGEANGRAVRVTTRWNATKTFLRQDVMITVDGQETSGSVQVIGWDARAGQIRSWGFYDDGGHGQGVWSQEAHVWMVLVESVRPDGTTTNATHIYRFVDQDTLICQSIHGSVGDEVLPDVEVTLTRRSDSE